MRYPFTQGRDFDDRDREGAPCVAIINEAFVQRYLGGTAAPLGKRLTKREGGRDAQRIPCEIVGVIRDNEWHSLSKEVPPFYSLAHHQSESEALCIDGWYRR